MDMLLSIYGDVGLYALIAVGVLAIGGAIARVVNRRSRPLRIIGHNLDTVANRIEVDLAQLQLEDAYGSLSAGWNRLILEAEQARRELEALQVEQQARETVGQYQATWATELLSKMSHGLLILSEDLNIAFANPAAARLLGHSEQELLDRNATEVLDASLASLATAKGGIVDRTFDLVAGDVSVRLRAVRIRGRDGDGQIALFVYDTSHQKEMEEARDQFLYHITHELRTPLTNIRAYAETLLEGVLEDPDSLRECYNVIIGETERLSRLVEDILNVSQLEAGSARLDSDDVQTARLIRQVVEDMQAAADEKNVELTLSLPSKVPVIRGDKERLAVVLTNLIGNAVKYTPTSGHVEVSCAEDGARLQIVIRDTGIGIAPEEQARVFDKFYRSSNEEAAGQPGTGLGLAIARETVRSHGGTIELESEPGEGSTFTVWLPVGRSSVLKSSEDG